MKENTVVKTSNSRIATSRKMFARQRGQSLAIAVAIMFVLLFIGGIFVALVARNLSNAGRGRDTVLADEIAQAGVEYVNTNLMYSPEGADWRPKPRPALSANATAAEQLAYANDPDRMWLDQGYSRVLLSNGRALVRVGMSYDPRHPLGQLIKIESIGRVGALDDKDPTTWPIDGTSPRLRREKIAYKSISITDYLRFVTQRFPESKSEAVFGTPNISVPLTISYGSYPVRFQAGAPPSYQTGLGARIHVNGNARFLNGLEMVVDPRLSQFIHVAGTITIDDTSARPVLKYYDPFAPTPYTLTTVSVFGSNELFNTFNGIFRDGVQVPDQNGYSRGIPYINPPLLDTPDPATGLTRYVFGTRDSGLTFTRHDGSSFNTGRTGQGSGIYIDNYGNFERETSSVNGGQSLRSILLKPGSTPNWNGPHYVPPGSFIEFGYPVVATRDDNGVELPGQYRRQAGIRIIRDVNDRPWTDPNGVLGPRDQTFTFFIYKPARTAGGPAVRPILKLESPMFRKFLADEIGDGHVPNPKGLPIEQAVDNALPEFNGLIYAEGNIRTRGLLPSKQNMPVRIEPGDSDSFTVQELRDLVNPPAMSVVSGQNIYIEGSIVREAQGADSMLALMAQKYVAVNTTMFMSPNKAMDYAGSNSDEQPPFHTPVTMGESAQAPPFTFDWLNGDDSSLYRLTTGGGAQAQDPSGFTMNQVLLTRHGVSPGITFLNYMINEAFPPQPAGGCTAGVNCDPLYRFNAPAVPAWVYPMNNTQPSTDLFEQRQFTLQPRQAGVFYTLNTNAGSINTIRPAVDPTVATQSGAKDYLFSRLAVAPMDIRIEALIYAQNESFFIVPGYALNQNPADTRDAALRRGQDAQLPVGTMLRPPGTTDMYPFYNEPYDCRITIVGAVSECRTASAADQAAWLQLWGYIPEAFGSTGKNPPDPNSEIRIPQEHTLGNEMGGANIADSRTTAERNFYGQDSGFARGLRFIYDPALAAPFNNYTPGGKAFRTDNYGRVLPPLPRLPVSPGYAIAADDRP